MGLQRKVIRYVPFLLGATLLISLSCSEIGQMLCITLFKTYLTSAPETPWHPSTFWHDANIFPMCSMDACFNFTRCAALSTFLIYIYGPPFEPFWYLRTLSESPWVTSDPHQACVFLIIEPESFSFLPFRPHPSVLPYWNDGLNHGIVSLSDKWSETSPPSHTIGNASVLASSLQETAHRPGFDISIPLPGKTHLHHLQCLQPWNRKYFLTFKGTRYIGNKEGNFRSWPAFREMHNGDDVIIAVTCNHETNNKTRSRHPEEGHGCDKDEVTYEQYDFRDLMNTTFGLAPAGRSPSSFRLIETLSAGAIPVLIADNYVKPFDTMIQWHRCILQFPTMEMARIVPALRVMLKEEMERRQRYCLCIYREFLKDDASLARSIVRALQLRFYGMLPQFREALPTCDV